MTVFKNNFLTLCYVLLAITVIESFQQSVLKKAIIKVSDFEFHCYLKTITIK